jgi:hypothetical protein
MPARLASSSSTHYARTPARAARSARLESHGKARAPDSKKPLPGRESGFRNFRIFPVQALLPPRPIAKVVPLPSSLSTLMSQPRSSQMRLTSESPTPWPVLARPR